MLRSVGGKMFKWVVHCVTVFLSIPPPTLLVSPGHTGLCPAGGERQPTLATGRLQK